MGAPDPNWGPGKLIFSNNERLVDPAAVLALFRRGGTPRADAAYEAACEAWQEIKDDPSMTENQKRHETIKRAMVRVDPATRFETLISR